MNNSIIYISVILLLVILYFLYKYNSNTLTVGDNVKMTIDVSSLFSIGIINSVCAEDSGTSTLIFTGKVCNVNGNNISVKWDIMENPKTSVRCGGKSAVWKRSDGNSQDWLNNYLGDCGKPTTYGIPSIVDASKLTKI